MINSSVEPIYLYDEERKVRALGAAKGNNKVGMHLFVCYGTVAQVQAVLNQIERKHEERKENQLAPVQVEEYLGIYVK